MSIADEFWLHVDKDGGPDHLKWETLHHAEGDGSSCWIWLRSKNSGYGNVWVRELGRAVMAHRYAWELEIGPIPEGMIVGHYCDHPTCVNPDHLYLGAFSDSAQYMVEKGHHGAHLHPEKHSRGDHHYLRLHPEKVLRGEQSSRAKLTEEQVKEIRRLRQAGMTLEQLAIRFDIAPTSINRICNGERWNHVEGRADFSQTYAPGEDFVIERGIPVVHYKSRWRRA
jgi:hypothetical protein